MERADAKPTASGASRLATAGGTIGNWTEGPRRYGGIGARVPGGRATVNERSVPYVGDRDSAAHPVDGGRASGVPSGSAGERGARARSALGVRCARGGRVEHPGGRQPCAALPVRL